MQIVFAGKAHPADEPAKHNLQRVFKHALDPKFGGRLAFIDDYDMHVAHYLVQGCDVWLNNPRKPLEASGTSGMKASLNGVPHLSIGDGWWAEGFNGRNGWLIESQANPDDHAATDAADANALYELLENEVVPAFYDRDRGGRGLPRRWIAIVREAMRSNVPRFSTRRMVKQYVTEMYGPAAQATTIQISDRRLLIDRDSAIARDLISVASSYQLVATPARISGEALFVRSVASRASRAVSINLVIAASVGLVRPTRGTVAVVPTTIATCCISAALTLSMVSRLVW